MAKMLPIETRQSILEDPSSGSKHTTYFPCLSVSISMQFVFSSETRRHVVYDDCSILIKSSLERTSSFLTSSPWTFVSPEIPCLFKIRSVIFHLPRFDITYSLAMPALRTADPTALMAVWMQLTSCERSPEAPANFFCSASTKRVSVIAFASKAVPCWVIVTIYTLE